MYDSEAPWAGMMARGDTVLVTTSKRGVFVGTLHHAEQGGPDEGLVVYLTRLRMVIYWPDRGVMSLQTRTDVGGCRFGDVSPGGRIPYVDFIGPVTEAAATAIMAL